MPLPTIPVEHRVRVYQFGAVWHWKCKLPPYVCSHGGRFRSQSDALERARLHYNMQGNETEADVEALGLTATAAGTES